MFSSVPALLDTNVGVGSNDISQTHVYLRNNTSISGTGGVHSCCGDSFLEADDPIPPQRLQAPSADVEETDV